MKATSGTYIEAIKYLFDAAKIPYSFGEHGVKTRYQYKYPETELPLTENCQVYNYLKMRGISKETIDSAGIMQDAKGNIVFPYYSTGDVLKMVKYRPSRKLDKTEDKMWCQKNADTSPVLFNMNRININSPLLIVEGEIDCLAAIEAGYTNAVSVPFGANNYHWIEHCWDFLEQFDHIVICSDNDDAGVKMQKECVYRLGSWRTKFVEIPKTIKKGNGEDAVVKDLNEVLFYLGKKGILDLIYNAKDSPIESVADFSDITSLDLDEVDGVRTGFPDIDNKLMRLFYGTFTIVTGINGGGKSTFLSQLICNALDDDQNCFLYSGELPNFQSKNWIDYIFAGQRHLKQYNTNGANYWKITPDARKKINDFYRSKLFIYKDGYSHKAEDLLKTMEDATRKYGVKLHILDNLTSISLDANEKDKYIKQEQFVTQLIDFSKKYNVAIILVVHPHKIETMRRLTKMDVQGISAIIDLAHRIISLYRVSEADKKGIPGRKESTWYKEPIKYDTLVDILKDRMIGFEGATAGLYYDRASRRFYYDEKSLDRKYKWDNSTYDSSLPFLPDTLCQEKEIFGEIKK